MKQESILIELKNGQGHNMLSHKFPHCIQFTLPVPIKIEQRDSLWVWRKDTADETNRLCQFLSDMGCEYIVHLCSNVNNDTYTPSYIIRFKDKEKQVYTLYLDLGISLCKQFNTETFIYRNGDLSVIDKEGDLLSWIDTAFFEAIDDDDEEDDEILEEEPSTFVIGIPHEKEELKQRQKLGELFLES